RVPARIRRPLETPDRRCVFRPPPAGPATPTTPPLPPRRLDLPPRYRDTLQMPTLVEANTQRATPPALARPSDRGSAEPSSRTATHHNRSVIDGSCQPRIIGAHEADMDRFGKALRRLVMIGYTSDVEDHCARPQSTEGHGAPLRAEISA